MTILVVDIGTTHSKAGLFDPMGSALHIATHPTPRAQHGRSTVIPAEALWDAVCAAIGECVHSTGQPTIRAVGIASMAETGLLIDRQTGQPRSPLLPWFDPGAAPAARLLSDHDTLERFQAFGIHPSFKCSLAKILELRQTDPQITDQAIWLCAADYIAFKMTGCMATDYSLAGRTYAFDLRSCSWDTVWLALLGLPTDIFPRPHASGSMIGSVSHPDMLALGMSTRTSVAICGHDHICAGVAAGAGYDNRMLDSMGTAEALLGLTAVGSRDAKSCVCTVADRRNLSIAEYSRATVIHSNHLDPCSSKLPLLDQSAHQSGISFGIMPLAEHWYWIGGLSTSGGALDWLRSLLGDPPLSYTQLQALLTDLPREPGSIIFLPFLAGNGPPQPNSMARAAFLGLTAQHNRADMLRAVLEGIAFQIESIRRTAQQITGHSTGSIIIVGGGSRNQVLLQLKADIAGLPLTVLHNDEATLLGAALLTGLGCGLYRSADELVSIVTQQKHVVIEPDIHRYSLYMQRFEYFQEWQQIIAKTWFK